MDPEEVRALQSELFREAAGAIERYEGFVEKFVGDAVMAVFGAPVAHEDDPERALRAALLMHERAAALSQHWAGRLRQTLELHIGINSGPVVAGNLGPGSGAAYAVTGDTVNTAARLLSAAPAGPDDVLPGRPPRETDEHSAGVGLPVGSTDPHERGHEVDAIIALQRARHVLRLLGAPEKPQAVTEPLDRRAGDEDGAFQRVSHSSSGIAGHGGDQSVTGGDRLGARVEEEERPCAVRVLREAGLVTTLSEERGLLVAGHTGDGHVDPEVLPDHHAEVPRARPDVRQELAGHAQQAERPVVPGSVAEMIEERARGVRRIRGVGRAVGEPRDQPGVDRTDGELAALGSRTQLGTFAQQPRDLRPGEIGIEDQARALTHLPFVARLFQLPAQPRGSAVLPHDRARDRLERLPVPEDDRLARVRDAHAVHVGTHPLADSRRGERLARDAAADLPDLGCVVLDPARLRKVLGELGVRPSEDAAVLRHHQAGRAGGALVDGEDGRDAHVQLSSGDDAAELVAPAGAP
jgi:hypothetical protein